MHQFCQEYVLGITIPTWDKKRENSSAERRGGGEICEKAGDERNKKRDLDSARVQTEREEPGAQRPSRIRWGCRRKQRHLSNWFTDRINIIGTGTLRSVVEKGKSTIYGRDQTSRLIRKKNPLRSGECRIRTWVRVTERVA